MEKEKMKTAIYCVSKDGYDVALKIRKNVYNNAHIYVSSRVYSALNLEVEKIDYVTEVTTRIPIALDTTFNKYDLHIFVAATGAVVRLIDGKFKTKDTDPAVISVDDHGSFVVSLLSGHLGGANEQCRKIAEGIGAVPVVTTASEVGGKIAVDTLSQKINAKLDNLEDAKRVTALIVNGENISLHLPENVVDAEDKSNTSGAIIISNRKKIEISKIIPQNIFIGIGCRRGITKEHIIEKLTYIMDNQNLEMSSIKMAASAWVKSDEIGLIDAMAELNIPIKFFDKEEILQVEDLIEDRSEYVKKTIGVYGVSEPCAYLAAKSEYKSIESGFTESDSQKIKLTEITENTGHFLVKKVKLDGMTLSIFEEDIKLADKK